MSSWLNKLQRCLFCSSACATSTAIVHRCTDEQCGYYACCCGGHKNRDELKMSCLFGFLSTRAAVQYCSRGRGDVFRYVSFKRKG